MSRAIVQELPLDLIKECRQIAEDRGYTLMGVTPEYSMIGKRGKALVIERATEELIETRMTVTDKDGRPWVKVRWPDGGFWTDYYVVGWRI